jgi:hypothetical protein
MGLSPPRVQYIRTLCARGLLLLLLYRLSSTVKPRFIVFVASAGRTMDAGKRYIRERQIEVSLQFTDI